MFGGGSAHAQICDSPLFLPHRFAPANAPLGVSLGDLDSAGDLDIVVANEYLDRLSVLLNLSNAPCPGTVDRDGGAGADVCFASLDTLAGGETDVCDISGDGDFDADDIFGYPDLFAAAC